MSKRVKLDDDKPSQVSSNEGSEGSNLLMRECITPTMHYTLGLRTVMHASQSNFQFVQVMDSCDFGKLLVLDGKIQSAQVDESVYHECLVHPALLRHTNPRNVMIAGGGEGATLREVLRHTSVKKCVMVDIDGLAVDLCRQHLPLHSAGAFEDKRTELVINDARQYLIDYKSKFDVIIFDLADPVDDGPCFLLYAKEFYEEVVKPKLTDDGLIITQSGPGGLLTCTQVFSAIVKTLQSVFPHVALLTVFVPSFADEVAYTIASMKPIADLTSEDVDRLIEERIGGGASQLQFYDGESHRRVHSLPKNIRAIIEKEKRIITNDSPLYVP